MRTTIAWGARLNQVIACSSTKNAVTTFSANTATIAVAQMPRYFEFDITGTTATCKLSTDGVAWITTGSDTFACEGTSYGEHMDGPWRAGLTHAGRWCDVFEVRDFKIQRCFIYLDPDYAGLDTDRYPWLSEGGRDPSRPLG